MADGQMTFRVEQPPTIVFPYISNLENAPQWVPDLVSVEKITGGEIGVGTRYREVVQMGGRTSTAELEVTEYQPNSIFAHKGEGGPSRFSGRFVLEPDGSGTRVTHEYSVKLSGVAKLMTPIARRWVRKNVEQAADQLKKVIEQT